MPHLFVNRPRFHSLVHDAEDASGHFQWEAFNAWAYLVGGVVFLVGSVFFLPQHEEYLAVGTWLFIFGSVLFLIVSGHDLVEVGLTARAAMKKKESDNFVGLSNLEQDGESTMLLTMTTTKNQATTRGRLSKLLKHRVALETVSTLIYILGTVLYMIGSVFFLPSVGWSTVAASLFVLGSMLFIVGALLNAIQVFESPDMTLAAYANLTAVDFVIGSTLFLTGSIPYIWSFTDESDKRRLYSYLGWQFIFGSILFTLGGVVNFYRAFLNQQLEQKQRETGT